MPMWHPHIGLAVIELRVTLAEAARVYCGCAKIVTPCDERLEKGCQFTPDR